MITDEIIDRISGDLVGHAIDEQTIMSLRGAWPEIHFTWCMDDDIHGGRPVRETEEFNIYLVNGSATCLALTDDLDQASGLVIAEVIPEEED